MNKQLETQVLIVGAGSTGLSIARELSKYKVDVTVVEKGIDFSLGETKSSLGFIYSPLGINYVNSLILKSAAVPDIPLKELFEKGTLKVELGIEGFKAFPVLAEELDFSCRLYKSMAVGRTEDDFKQLKVMETIADSIGIELEHLDADGIQAQEPNINKAFTRGLAQYGDQYVLYPWEYGIALAENARDNGVKIMLLTEVWGITPLNGGFVVDTTNGQIKTRFIINAAGNYADKVAGMAGVQDFDLFFVGSLFYILDKRLAGMVNGVTSLAFRPGICGSVKPNISGNIQAFNSVFLEVYDAERAKFDRNIIEQDFAVFREIFPFISKSDVINLFNGVSPFNTRDPENHLLEVSAGNPNFLNAVVRMPGLGFSPAMAKYMVGLLGNQGLELTKKADFNPCGKRIPRVSELSDEERNKLIALDSRYGHIVCRCEEVSEGEIVEAIRRGARSVVGVKYRTRAGMGRCQRGFCGPRVVEILARELDIPVTEVTNKGGLSKVVLYRSKELFGVGG